MLELTDTEARERRARRLFEEQARRQGVPLRTEEELVALFPRLSDEDADAFGQMMHTVMEERRRQRASCERCSGTLPT